MVTERPLVLWRLQKVPLVLQRAPLMLQGVPRPLGVPLRPRGGERLSELVLASMVEAMDRLL
jgi:hypothetical protein